MKNKKQMQKKTYEQDQMLQAAAGERNRYPSRDRHPPRRLIAEL